MKRDPGTIGIMNVVALMALSMSGGVLVRDEPIEPIDPPEPPTKRERKAVQMMERASGSEDRIRRAAEKRARKADRLRALQSKGAIL